MKAGKGNNANSEVGVPVSSLVWGLHLALGLLWFWAQELFLAVLRGSCGMPMIEPWIGYVQGKQTPSLLCHRTSPKSLLFGTLCPTQAVGGMQGAL